MKLPQWLWKRRKTPMLSQEALKLELMWMTERVNNGRPLSQVNDAWARGVMFALIWAIGETPGAQPPQNALRMLAKEVPPIEGFTA